jgi:predicted dehydrogenase
MSRYLEGAFGMSVVGIVGAGKRYLNYYKDVIDSLDLEISGFVTRSGKISNEVGDYPVFQSMRELYIETDPDFFISVVPYSETPSIIQQACSLECDVLVEPPVGNFSQSEYISRQIHESGILAGVVEQWPFLPMECFKKTIIDSGVIGQVRFVENDHRTYNYHGIAQLRNYIGKKADVIKTVGSMRENYPLNGKEDYWNIILAHFNNNTTLLFKYSDLMGRCNDLRGNRTLRIYGETGTIISGCRIEDGVDLFTILDSEGTVHSLNIDIIEENNTVKEIFAKLPNGEDVVWKNPFNEFNFNEDQIAIALHIQEMIEAKVLWTIEDGFKDMSLGDSSWA